MDELTDDRIDDLVNDFIEMAIQQEIWEENEFPGDSLEQDFVALPDPEYFQEN